MKQATERVIEYATQSGLVELQPGDQLVVVSRRTLEIGCTLDDQRLGVRAHIVGDLDAVDVQYKVREILPCACAPIHHVVSSW